MKLLYEGKAKQVYATENPEEVVIYYKDDATAFNGKKKDTIKNKGIKNNAITGLIYEYLEENGIRTHYIKTLDERSQLCRKVKIFPLEVIVRNVIAGSMSKRLGIPEGTKPDNMIFEYCYKNDDYDDPLINDSHAVAMKLATQEELDYIKAETTKVNELLKKLFDDIGILLVDFKIEFGKDKDGNIYLADEISPDTCRFWDKETMEKLDKDRFRRDLGHVEDAYDEILNRVKERLAK